MTWASEARTLGGVGIKFKEMAGSGEIDYRKESLTGTRIFEVQHKDAKKFIDRICKVAYNKPRVPDSYFPGWKNMVAVSGRIIPKAQGQQRASHQSVDVVPMGMISYDNPDRTVVPGTGEGLVIISVQYAMVIDPRINITFAVANTNVSGKFYRFDDDRDKHPDGQVQVPSGTVEVVTRFEARWLKTSGNDADLRNWDTIKGDKDADPAVDGYIGKINSAGIIFPGAFRGSAKFGTAGSSKVSFAAETLQFRAAEFIPALYYGTDNIIYQYHFLYREQGWNTAWNPEEQEWKDIEENAGGNKPFVGKAFSKLFPTRDDATNDGPWVEEYRQ